MHRTIRIAVLIATLMACACAGTQQNGKTPAPASTSPHTAAAPAHHDDRLYRALGGQAGIARVVDASLAEIHGDLRINFLFEKTDLADLRRLIIEQLCAATLPQVRAVVDKRARVSAMAVLERVAGRQKGTGFGASASCVLSDGYRWPPSADGSPVQQTAR